MALPSVAAPRHVLTVPSTGEQVDYRPYLVKEEKVLMMAMESNDEKQIIRAILDTIKSCTDGKLDASGLATFDLEYIFLQLRSKSVGESSKIKIKCDSCEEFNTVKVNLDEIEAPAVDNKRRIVKLNDDLSIQLKYPSVNDAMKASSGGTQVDQIFDAIISSIDVIFYRDETLQAKDHTKQELMDFVESMNTAQFSELGEAVNSQPGIRKTVGFTCEKCGTENEKELKGLASFF